MTTFEKITIGNATLYCGDCLDVMQDIQSTTIDAVITDPPFFQGFNHNGVRSGRGDLSISKPFFSSFFATLSRLCKDERAVYLFTDWRTNDFFMNAMSEHFEVRNSLIWIKHVGNGRWYMNAYESILFHCEASRKMPFTNIITGIKSFNGGAKATNGAKLHPTQKPIELIERFINDSTQSGMTVLDPMMGSGTTGVACAKTGRQFTGIEIQRKYFDIACERIERAYAEQQCHYSEEQKAIEHIGLFNEKVAV